MEMHLSRHARALTFFLLLLTTPVSPAATLIAFDFDASGGGFEAGPEALHPRVETAVWTDLLGTIRDFAGNPGRAISANRFTEGNAFQLTLTAQAGYVLAIDSVSLDLRASASGPDSWYLSANAGPALSGVLTGVFSTTGGALVATTAAPAVLLTLDGSGASSAAGTLRVDNVVVHGTVTAVTIPPGVFLVVSPLTGLLLAASRRRISRAAGLTPARTATRARHRRAGNTAPA